MPVIVYTVLRLSLFAAALLIGWAVDLGGWLLVVVAAFVAWAVSYLVLAGPRDRAARWLAERAERRRASGQRFSRGVEADARAEDEAADEAADGAAAEAAERTAAAGEGQSASPSPSSTP